MLWKRRTESTVLSLLLVFVFAPGSDALSEIWAYGSASSIHRFTPSGTPLGSFTTSGQLESMAFTGSEVWVGYHGGDLLDIERFDLSGNLIGSAPINLGLQSRR